MKKILIPTDFSEHADNALNYALQLAKEIDASLYVLHACHQLDTRFTRNRALIAEHNESILQEAKSKIKAIKNSITSSNNIKVETCIYEGQAEETILYFSKKEQIEVIVMSTEGASGLATVFGSVTTGIIQRSAIPVLVIPKEYKWKVPAKVLFATKYFEETQSILEPVILFAELFNAKLSVTKFTDEDTAAAADYMENTELLFAYMHKLQHQYKTIEVEAKHLSGSEFEETLHEHINNDAVDMLAMVTYQRSLLERMFHPSSTKKMALYTHVPLMIIPCNENSFSKNKN